MKCDICGKEIVLVPSAVERARTNIGGNTPSYYTRLFTTHATCAIEKRRRDTVELMRRISAANTYCQTV